MGCSIGAFDNDDVLVPPTVVGELHHAQIWLSCCGEEFVNGVYQFHDSHSVVRYCNNHFSDVAIIWDDVAAEWQIVVESSGVVHFRADAGDHGARKVPQEGWEVVSGKEPAPVVSIMKFSMASHLGNGFEFPTSCVEAPDSARINVAGDEARAADLIALLPSPWLGNGVHHKAAAAALQEITDHRLQVAFAPPGWSGQREPKVIPYTMQKPQPKRSVRHTKSLYGMVHVVHEASDAWLDRFVALAGLTKHGVITVASCAQDLAGVVAWSSKAAARGLPLNKAGRFWVLYKGFFATSLADLVVEQGGDEHGVWSPAEWQEVKGLYLSVAASGSSSAAAACRVLGHREWHVEQKRKWYLDAAEGNDISAMLGLALHCETDLEKRRAWCMKAGKFGDPRADTLLGLLEADPIRQRAWFMKAAAAGHAPALIYLGRMEDTLALKRVWYEKAVMLGHSDADYNLGLIEQDVEKKRRYYKKAAATGHARAMLALAHDEDLSSDCDAADAERWYLEAARLGHADAMFHLAARCESDSAEKRMWYMDAADCGHAGAMYVLGCLSIDPGEKREWLVKAANSGCAKAMVQLGTLEGSSELRDEWYKKATDGGYDPFLMPFA